MHTEDTRGAEGPDAGDVRGSQRRFYERFEPARLTILRAVAKRPHRYRLYRGLTMIFTLVLLAVVPLLGLARFDLYSGEHRALFGAVIPLYGLIAVSVAIFAFYFFTFQVNLVAGRMFCGWGCPVGQLNRLADTVRAAKGSAKLLWTAALVGFATALALAIELWWTSEAAFLAWPWTILALAALASLSLGFVLFAQRIGWDFCRKACPIGLYYSVVQQQRPLGILFNSERCQDENACVRACPVLLDPKHMEELRTEVGGLAIEGLAANNHCLRCGACVEACELVLSKSGPPALYFGRPAAPVESEPLVQLPARRPAERPALEAPAPVPAEPELPPRELWLRGGPRGLWATGLAPVTIIAGVLLSSLVFALFGGPLWRLPSGTSMVPRILAAAAVAPVAAVLGLLWHRRWTLARFIHATGLVATCASVMVSLVFVALSPGSARTYRPRETWVEAPVENQNGPRSERYRPAPATFPSGVVEGQTTPGALVYLEKPGAGRPLPPPGSHVLRFGSAGLSASTLVLAAHDELALSTEGSELHTFQLSQKQRSVKNLPLPAHAPPRTLAAPPPGEYEVRCANHGAERAGLWVFDHPYYALAGEDGRFRWDAVPAGGWEIVSVSGDKRQRTTLRVDAGQVVSFRVTPEL